MNGPDALTSPAVMPAALEAARIDTVAATEADSTLGQDEFLKLMLTQIEHQDPFEPMQNGEFIGQMAQFSTVTGIEGMQSSLDDMATGFGAQQTLEAAALVGDEILVDGDSVMLSADGSRDVDAFAFALDTPAGDVTVSITGPSGELVSRRSLGEHASGRHELPFDGLDDDGQPLPAGQYRLTLSADHGDEQRQIDLQSAHRVASVEFGAGGGPVMNTAGGRAIALGDVREIRATAPAGVDGASLVE